MESQRNHHLADLPGQSGSAIFLFLQQQWKGAENHFHSHISNCIHVIQQKTKGPHMGSGLGLPLGQVCHTHLTKTLETVGNSLKAGKQKFAGGLGMGFDENTLKAWKNKISSNFELRHLFDLAMSSEEVSKRLDGIPVYAVRNMANEFVLVSDMNNRRSLGLFCFRKQDAEALLFQVIGKEPGSGNGAKVVAVSLNKVYELRKQGIIFRLLPDPHQVKNALEAASKAGVLEQPFPGVPVFQSDNLIIRSKDKQFRPLFFNKEDLEYSLSQAYQQKTNLYPSPEVNTDIQVGSFEDVIQRMENSEDSSVWEDIVFIPPGINAFNQA
ncbi:hypothetical protein KI387_019871, partial [Taxus chinensis]